MKMGVQCIYLRGIMIYMYALTGFFLSGKRKGGGSREAQLLYSQYTELLKKCRYLGHNVLMCILLPGHFGSIIISGSFEFYNFVNVKDVHICRKF